MVSQGGVERGLYWAGEESSLVRWRGERLDTSRPRRVGERPAVVVAAPRPGLLSLGLEGRDAGTSTSGGGVARSGGGRLSSGGLSA